MPCFVPSQTCLSRGFDVQWGLMFSASGAVDWVCQWLTARLSGQVGAMLIVLGCCHNATGFTMLQGYATEQTAHDGW